MEGLPINLLDKVLEAIDWRNKVVHEGKEAPQDTKQYVFKVLEFSLRVVEADYRFVSRNVGNKVMSRATWEADDGSI